MTGGDTLQIGLDYPEDPERNYGAAVVGRTKEQSLELFALVDRWLTVPEVMYAHRWRVGQVLVMDNQRVVHGRAAYCVDAPRKLRASRSVDVPGVSGRRFLPPSRSPHV
ncbi:TauD/TfdA family dioxygenase [Streptomyces rubradiris]|uniref:TauD/TfdA family dioxygenase n=1 Tax=Streptomyces rubradiris TaxID=285531 RepID=UPI0019447986|nr:TauD/TfdA family dioxygenase [Streptomyces rubradiris]